MPGTIPAARKHLIDSIAAQARARRARKLPGSLPEFVRSYYRGVDETDLRTSEAASLAAAAAAHLEFGAVRRAGRALVRVFNPTVETDGWSSSRTVVEVVTDDMPFLVDSLAIVLLNCGLSIHTMVHPVFTVRRDRAGRIECIGTDGDGVANPGSTSRSTGRPSRPSSHTFAHASSPRSATSVSPSKTGRHVAAGA